MKNHFSTLQEAITTIALLRGLDVNDKEVQNEFQYLRNDDVYFKSIPDVSLKTICTYFTL